MSQVPEHSTHVAPVTAVRAAMAGQPVRVRLAAHQTASHAPWSSSGGDIPDPDADRRGRGVQHLLMTILVKDKGAHRHPAHHGRAAQRDRASSSVRCDHRLRRLLAGFARLAGIAANFDTLRGGLAWLEASVVSAS
jgi:hypothetical protein